MKRFEGVALGVTQGFFGETVEFTHGEVVKEAKVIFRQQWMEVNQVSTFELVAKVVLAHLPFVPSQETYLFRGTTRYRAAIVQVSPLGHSADLILREA